MAMEKAIRDMENALHGADSKGLLTCPETRIKERLSYLQFKRRNVVQDENTVFRVLSDQIFGSQVHHLLMRRAIAAQLRNNPSRYNDDVSGDYVSYCNNVAANVPGSLVCIMAACDLFVVMFMILGDAESYVMEEVARPSHGEYRKVIYSCKSGDEMHSMVPFSDHQLPVDPNINLKVQELGQILHQEHDLLLKCRDFHKYIPGITVSKVEKDMLSERLRIFRFQKKRMIGDGNCLFRTLSDQIHNDQEDHLHMRNVIVAKLRADPNLYKDLYSARSNETYDQYCDRMAIACQWGDYGCIQAACDLFGVKMVLLGSNPKEAVFIELEPNVSSGKGKVIYGCTEEHHMDAMYPLAGL